MDITDPGFQDFRSDASCQIRPQSLIGEKFVDCRPTLPRAPGTPPPPPLKQIPDGEEGAGQYLLPLGSNGTSVDPDLINDIQTLPYAQRFRLIFNELGAGLAGRGEDLEVLVKRANPVLRDVDRLFGILSAQRDELAQLASDSDEILRPVRARARPRRRLLRQRRRRRRRRAPNAAPQLEASLRKFPTFLREFRTTMRSLQGFSDAATPVFADLGKAAPVADRRDPDADPVLGSDDGGAEEPRRDRRSVGPDLRAKPTRSSARRPTWPSPASTPTTELAKLFTSIEKTKGWDGLVELIYNTTASLNGFDQYGHFGRTLVTLTNCLDYEPSHGRRLRLRRPLQRPQRRRSDRERQRRRPLPPAATASRGKDRRHRRGPRQHAGPTTGLGQADATGGEAGVGNASKTAAAPHRSSTTSWDHEEPQRHTGSGEQPDPGRGGDVLVVIVAVFLAYNANNGLPFVSTYDLKAQVPNANALVKGNEVRIGGVRVGIVKSVVPVQLERRRGRRRTRRSASTRASNRCRSTRRSTIRPKSALGLKFLQVTPGDSSRGLRGRRHDPGRRLHAGTGRHRPVLRHVRRADPRRRSARTRPASATPSPAAARS